MLATEACMRSLARHFQEDEEKWGTCGLLHDLDYDETAKTPEVHGLKTVEWLREKGVGEEILLAILAHNSHKPAESLIEKALYAVDPLTGLIVASALMHPDKKLNSIDKNFVLRRFKEKRFAAGANREQIKSCEVMGISLEEFVDICLKAMQEIAPDLGL
jgi:putative nucleotidyltransferase with HDIG domain